MVAVKIETAKETTEDQVAKEVMTEEEVLAAGILQADENSEGKIVILVETNLTTVQDLEDDSKNY